MSLISPRLEVDLGKIRHNTRVIVGTCKPYGIEVIGVTKGVSAMPQVGKAMLECGAVGLADARIRNIDKLRAAGIDAKIMLLRLPRISHAAAIAEKTDCSLNSEFRTIRRLTEESQRLGRQHGIILMIDVGDLREGIMYTHALRGIKRILSSKHIHLLGIGTNVGCYGGVLPTEKNMGMLADIAQDIRKRFSIPLPVVSVGGTNCLPLIQSGHMPPQINQIRIGEGILLGRNSCYNTILNNTYQDAFTLSAEIVEIKDKPSRPIGSIGKDAFGNKPSFKNRGVRRRALIALGKQDVRLSGLIPADKSIKIVGGSSDYFILDISDCEKEYNLGDEIAFHLLYPGLLSVSSSPYVTQAFKEDAL